MSKKNLFICQLGEYFDVFLPEVRKSSPNTISAYAYSFTLFFQFLFDEKDLPHHIITYKNFTAALFDEYILWLENERNYSVSSIHQRITAITAFLKYASRREMSALSAYSVSKGTELPKTARTEFPYFTKEEMAILLALPNPHKYLGGRDLVFLSFLYDTAARADEMCKVRVCDVKFGAPTKVRLHGKGDKIREIPISDETADLVRYHLKEQLLQGKDCKEKPLFSSQTNEKMTTACVRSIVEKYVGIAIALNPKLFTEKSYSPHSFRHSKAVHMVEAGVNLIYIRNFLGHATISSTEIYARVGQSAVTKALTERKIPRIAANTPQSEKSNFTVPDFIARAK